MATRPLSPTPRPLPKSQRFTRASSLRRMMGGATFGNRSSRPQDCASRPSADLAGRSVGISNDVPGSFDVPLASHHKLIGRWLAKRDGADRLYTRGEARLHIERAFDEAVLDVLSGFELADLRIAVLQATDNQPPALVVFSDSVGQLNLGWIEKSNVLSDTLFGHVAPVRWRATAYKAVADTLGAALPVITYDDLFEEVSAYYWDGELTDEGARDSLMQWQGHDPGDIDAMTLPSGMNAKRPDFMLAENTAPLKDLPRALCQRLRAIRDALTAMKDHGPQSSAWRFESDVLHEYLPDYMDCSHLPPITVVPFDHFAQELDDVARHGMENGFSDIAGICPVPDAGKVDEWFASLKLGSNLLRAVQDLVDFDPAKA